MKTFVNDISNSLKLEHNVDKFFNKKLGRIKVSGNIFDLIIEVFIFEDRDPRYLINYNMINLK